VKFEPFTAVMFQVEVFWVVTLCSVPHILPQHYKVSWPRRPQLEKGSVICSFYELYQIFQQCAITGHTWTMCEKERNSMNRIISCKVIVCHMKYQKN